MMDPLSAAKRDAVTRLCQAQAEGLLSVEVFEERYALIRDAVTPGTVQAIVADLEPTRDLTWSGAAATSETGAALSPDLPAQDPTSIRIPAVLSSISRAGDWTVPEVVELMVILGEATLDFRDAAFTRETVVVDVSVWFGSVKLLVPPGTQVENECQEFMASSKQPKKRRRTTPSNGLLVVVRGSLRLAELVIKERVPTGEGPLLLEPPAHR